MLPRLSEVNLYSESQEEDYDVVFDTIFQERSPSTMMSNSEEIVESPFDMEKPMEPLCGKKANLFDDLTTLTMPASVQQ